MFLNTLSNFGVIVLIMDIITCTKCVAFLAKSRVQCLSCLKPNPVGSTINVIPVIWVLLFQKWNFTSDNNWDYWVITITWSPLILTQIKHKRHKISHIWVWHQDPNVQAEKNILFCHSDHALQKLYEPKHRIPMYLLCDCAMSFILKLCNFIFTFCSNVSFIWVGM